jgi:acyl carrier protein
MTDIRTEVQSIFQDVFDDPSIELRDEMTGADIEDWTSLTHISLIIAIEKRLGVNFATAEISKLKSPGENVGSLLKLIEKKIKKA